MTSSLPQIESFILRDITFQELWRHRYVIIITESLRNWNLKSLSCEAFGIPEPTISWEWNNENLDSFEITEDGLSILTKENVAVSDSGVYTCVAVSIAGQARHDIMATVYRAPTIEIIGEDGNIDLTGTTKVRDLYLEKNLKRFNS